MATDADGRRVQKTSTVGNYSDPAGAWIFFHDQSGRMVQEFNSPGNTFVRGHIYASSRHLASVGGRMSFSHSDWLGTERFRTYMANIPYLTETCASLPFGDGLNCTGSDVDPLHFTGKERDAATGLDYFGARFDSSSFGRFMSPDPYNSIIIRQGMKSGGLPEEAVDSFFDGFLDDPQNWDKYTYALNNPLRFVDPTGAAPSDHHLLVERDTLFRAGTLARDFAERIRTGPLSGNGYPNSDGFNKLHRAYNDAVKELLNQAVQKEGPAEGWTLQQWKDFANSVLNSDEPAIKQFLDELEENNPGAKAALASSIAAYRVSASVVARVIAAGLLRSLLRTLILCVNCDHPREEIKIRIIPGPPPA
jgi:RHS repeat-associated protein